MVLTIAFHPSAIAFALLNAIAFSSALGLVGWGFGLGDPVFDDRAGAAGEEIGVLLAIAIGGKGAETFEDACSGLGVAAFG